MTKYLYFSDSDVGLFDDFLEKREDLRKALSCSAGRKMFCLKQVLSKKKSDFDERYPDFGFLCFLDDDDSSIICNAHQWAEKLKKGEHDYYICMKCGCKVKSMKDYYPPCRLHLVSKTGGWHPLTEENFSESEKIAYEKGGEAWKVFENYWKRIWGTRGLTKEERLKLKDEVEKKFLTEFDKNEPK